MKTKLYAGLWLGDKRYNYADIGTITGGSLAVLDNTDKSGAARLLNLIKKSVKKFCNEAGDVYELQDEDYLNIYVFDAWKISREAMRLVNEVDSLIFPEYFFCDVCSTMGNEKYTKVEEDWDILVANGLIDEIYIEEIEGTTSSPYYWTDLPVGIEINTTKQFMGGTFKRIKREPITLGKLLKIQKNKFATESEANSVFVMWDESIVEIEGMSLRDFNLLVRRNPFGSFCKQYINNKADQEAMSISENENILGYDAEPRSVLCKHCGSEIGGYLDFTNFFQSLLPKKSIPKRKRY